MAGNLEGKTLQKSQKQCNFWWLLTEVKYVSALVYKTVTSIKLKCAKHLAITKLYRKFPAVGTVLRSPFFCVCTKFFLSLK